MAHSLIQSSTYRLAFILGSYRDNTLRAAGPCDTAALSLSHSHTHTQSHANERIAYRNTRTCSYSVDTNSLPHANTYTHAHTRKCIRIHWRACIQCWRSKGRRRHDTRILRRVRGVCACAYVCLYVYIYITLTVTLRTRKDSH